MASAYKDTLSEDFGASSLARTREDFDTGSAEHVLGSGKRKRGDIMERDESEGCTSISPSTVRVSVLQRVWRK